MQPSAAGSAPPVRDNVAAQRLEIGIDGQVAYAEYQRDRNLITFTHTRVPEALRGRGLGTQLVEAGVRLAQDQALKVIPKCPFFAAYFAAHPQLRDLLA